MGAIGSKAAQQATGMRYVGLAAALLIALLVIRLVFLAFLSPWMLIEDEAHYWEWSARLDWSYYSKGPVIAYLIAAGTRLFGDTELGVRCMAPVMAAGLGWCVYALGRDVSGSDRVGLLGLIALHLAPIVAMLGVIMTIDGSYLAGWALACWLGWQAIERQRGWAWPALGAAIGLAFLAKYTALVLVPSLMIYIVLRRADRKPWRSAWFWMTPITLAITMLPVVIWNAQHDWVTVRHVLGHAHVGGHAYALRWQPWWFFEYLATQLGAVGITLFPLCIAAIVWAIRPGNAGRRGGGAVYLVCCGAPILALYTIAAVFIEVEGNWPVAAYVTLLPLAAWAVADRIAAGSRRAGRWRFAWHWAVGYGIVGALIGLRPDLVNLPAATLGSVSLDIPYVFPHKRLIGAHELADQANRARETYGGDPFYIVGHYGRASRLAFYSDGHPIVYCSSSRMQGRQAQHDMWPETDLDKPELFSRNAVLIGKPVRNWQREEAFDEIIILDPIEVVRHGQVVIAWQRYVGVGYRGFAQAPRDTF
ncbi:MAG: glycosyltransferase family 39 protein [Phycisphaerales bacterium]|nr:glycosyltransferase family 39 protein [Phycisphaerales bacterium]